MPDTTSILLEQYKIAEARRTTFGRQFMQTAGFVIAIFVAAASFVAVKDAVPLRLICAVGAPVFLAIALLGYRLGRRQDDCEKTLGEIEDAFVSLGHLGIVRMRRASRFGARAIMVLLMAAIGVLLAVVAATPIAIK